MPTIAAMPQFRSHRLCTRRNKVEAFYIKRPLGVRGRNYSDNHLIAEKLHGRPSRPLIYGLETTYAWVDQQVAKSRSALVA